MQVDAAEPRRREHVLGQDAPVGDHHRDVRRELTQLPSELAVTDLARLEHGQTELERALFHGRRPQRQASSCGLVRLSDHRHHVGDLGEGHERGDGEVWTAEEDGARAAHPLSPRRRA